MFIINSQQFFRINLLDARSKIHYMSLSYRIIKRHKKKKINSIPKFKMPLNCCLKNPLYIENDNI